MLDGMSWHSSQMWAQALWFLSPQTGARGLDYWYSGFGVKRSSPGIQIAKLDDSPASTTVLPILTTLRLCPVGLLSRLSVGH